MSRFDLVIRGGTVVTAADRFPADIGVRDGRIVALGDSLDRGETICREFEFLGSERSGRFLRCDAPNPASSWRPPGAAAADTGAARD